MPGIAEGVRGDRAQFYWHLGNYRANYDFDQDLLAAPEYRSNHLSIADYQRIEWQDFISQQIDPFGDIPVYLGIGNHELVPPKTRSDFIQQFADWLDSPTIRAQRLRDDPSDHKLRTYNHWIQGGVDFISLDNASFDQFDDAQVAWIERVLARDEIDANIRGVVVGMHDALPDSISTGHGMNESAQMERSGRRVYQDLLAFRSRTKKYVYVLASHSHFLIEDVYNNVCHPKPESVLPGWIVGTAGAVRYRLPANLTGASRRERMSMDIFLRQLIPTERSSLSSRKSNPSTSQIRPSSGTETGSCKRASTKTSRTMLPKARVVQPVSWAATRVTRSRISS